MKKHLFMLFMLLSMWAVPTTVVAQDAADPDPIDALEGYLRDLDQRITRLEAAVERMLVALQGPTEPPAVVPPPAVIPPSGIDPSPPGRWPRPPIVSLLYDSRDEPPVEVTVRARQWEKRDGRRFSKVGNTIDNTQFIVWFEQTRGLDATRVTIAAINGLDGAGPSYYEQYRISVGGRIIENVEGQHVIPPRYAIFRRISIGPDARTLTQWTYLPSSLDLPEWAPAKAAQDTEHRVAFPFRDMGGHPVDLGPFNFFWHNHDLSNSHGGWGVAPFHGGPDDWLVCPEGRANREAEMLLDFQRPIWFLDADYEPFSPFSPYWMGRTAVHEPPGYQYTLDDWCSYGHELSKYRFADYTHLSRGTGGAAALAPYDIVAEACLEMVFTDYKTAYSLDPDHPGKDQGNWLLRPLWQKIEMTNGPSASGNRGLGHLLRLLRWCRPYFDTEPYDRAMRLWVKKLSDQNGMTLAEAIPPWAMNPEVLTHPLEAPLNYTFQQQLTTYEIGRFGGLDDIASAGRRFLTARPPSAFEMREGELSDTVFDRHHSASEDQEDPKWAYLAYGHMTHSVLLTHETPEAFVANMASRGVNGSSQDMDCTPKSVWAPPPVEIPPTDR